MTQQALPLGTSSTQPHPRLLVRWFVQYNPMFTASALCVLGGVLALSRGFGAGADVGLTAILELYQWLVIGVAALLYRRLLERRPAAILGVIQLVFMVDPTLQLSALATGGQLVATACWVVLFVLKWRALAWAFRLKLSTSARVLPPLVAALAALLPNAQLLGADSAVLPTALAVGVFAVGLAFAFAPPSVSSRQALGDVGVVMFPRLARAAVAIGAVGLVYQCVNTLLAAGPRAALPALGALAFVHVVRTKSERAFWVATFAGLGLCHAGGAGALAGLPLASVALLLASFRTFAHAPRVFTAAILGVVGTAAVPVLAARESLLGSPAVVLVGVVATLALLHALRTRRAWSAVPALALLHGRFIAIAVTTYAPQGGAQWGATMLAAGFVLLPLGVVLHRRLSKVIALDDAALELARAAGSAAGARASSEDAPRARSEDAGRDAAAVNVLAPATSAAMGTSAT